MKKIAIFASGNGTNFQAVIDAVNDKRLFINVGLLICDKIDAYVIKRAKEANIPTFSFSVKDFESKEHYEKEILNELKKYDIEFIALCGYMRLMGKTILSSYEGNIINVHPSLLPAFKGLHAIEQAIEYGVKVMGVTIHYIDSGMDTGCIIAQDSFRLTGTETVNQIEAQVHAIEHRLYIETLKKLLEG